MGAVWLRSWAGGRVRDVNGREVFVIEKRIGGRRFVITLDSTSEDAALAELALFMRSPLTYRTKKDDVRMAPVGACIDKATLQAFAEYCEQKGLSEGHRKHVLKPYLTAWGTALRDRDLRTVTLRELNEHLDGWKTARQHRIVALKSLTGWMRERDLLRRSDDPTLDLKVPQSVAEKSVRRKGYTMFQVEQVYANVTSQVLRDMMCLRSKTGMHGSEIDRLARGEAELRRVDDPSGIAGTITFRHLKAGKIHVVSVDAQTYSAAQRLRERGSALSRRVAIQQLDRCAKRLSAEEGRDVPALRLEELRHSFATWGRGQGRLVRPNEGGVPLEEVAAVMGHFTPRTTSVFYEGNEVPAMIALPLSLMNAGDPAPATTSPKKARRPAPRRVSGARASV